MAESFTTKEETDAANTGDASTDALASPNASDDPENDSLLDGLVDEVKGQFESARERLAESSSAFLDWIESTKTRIASDVEAQRTARQTAEAAADQALADRAAAEKLASETAARAAQAGPEHAGAGTAALRDAVMQLDGADSQAELLSRLLEQACRFGGRSALLLGAGDAEGTTAKLEVWNSSGFDEDKADRLRGRGFPRPDAWEPVLAAEQTVALEGSNAAAFADAMDQSAPSRAVVIPFVLRDSAYAVLYADDHGDETDGAATPFDIDALQVACFIAAQSMECLTLRSIRPAATLIAPSITDSSEVAETATATSLVADDPADDAAEIADEEQDQAVPESEDDAQAEGAVGDAEADPAEDSEDAPAEQAGLGADTAAQAFETDDVEPPQETRLFADQLSTPDHYESAATDVSEDAAATGEDDTSAEEQDAVEEDATEEDTTEEDTTEEDTTEEDHIEAPTEADLSATAKGFHIPAPPAVPAATEWSLTPEADGDTPAQGIAAETIASWKDTDSSTSFVSVLEESQPPPPSPLATQAIPTDPTTPPVPGFLATDSDEPSDEAPGLDDGPISGAKQLLADSVISQDADEAPDAGGPASPPPVDGLGFATPAPDSTRPPRPLALDSLNLAPTAADAAPPSPAEVPLPAVDAIADLDPPNSGDVSSITDPFEPEGLSGSPAVPAGAEEHESPSLVQATPAISPSLDAEITPPNGPSKTSPGSAEVMPPTDLSGPGMAFNRETPAGEDPRVDEARRLARLLVSELKLYNEDEIARGKRLGNIYQSLREDIDRSRRIYDERVDTQIRQSGDFLHEELVQGLANGDPGLLGM